MQTQGNPPPATTQLPILPLHLRCRASQGCRECRLSLHHTQPTNVRIYPSMGVLPLLGRRADAHSQFV